MTERPPSTARSPTVVTMHRETDGGEKGKTAGINTLNMDVNHVVDFSDMS